MYNDPFLRAERDTRWIRCNGGKMPKTVWTLTALLVDSGLNWDKVYAGTSIYPNPETFATVFLQDELDEFETDYADWGEEEKEETPLEVARAERESELRTLIDQIRANGEAIDEYHGFCYQFEEMPIWGTEA